MLVPLWWARASWRLKAGHPPTMRLAENGAAVISAPERSWRSSARSMAATPRLARVLELSAQSSRHERVRVARWVRKLREQPVSNAAWLKNVAEHAAALLQMLLDGLVEEPFLKMPPEGPLPTLPRHKVARLAARVGMGHPRRQPEAGQDVATRSSALLLRRLLEQEEKDDEQVLTPKKVDMQSKQIQTSDQDDQWDWQRVWKGVFEKMRSELLDRSAQIQSMSAEMKELRTLVAAQKLALEQHERVSEGLRVKHRAELENARSLHALELESLKAKHKKQLHDVSLQNERLLRERRRDVEMGSAFNMQSESYGDFLACIDAFYADTLKLTKSA